MSRAARRGGASARVTELSKPKVCPEEYVPCRDTVWSVRSATRRAVASNRVEELAKPNMRETMDHLQFDPDAFKVKETAKKAHCSTRVAELAQPISRGEK